MKLLIVDDSRIIRKVIHKYSRAEKNLNITVVGEAEDGVEAIRLYREQKPDIVTMDMTMPRLDGLDTIRQIIRLDPDARVLVITALNSNEMILRAMDAGALGYLSKPFSSEELIENLKSVMDA